MSEGKKADKIIIIDKGSSKYKNLSEDQREFYELNRAVFKTGNYLSNGVGLQWFNKRGTKFTIAPSSKLWIEGNTIQVPPLIFIRDIGRVSRGASHLEGNYSESETKKQIEKDLKLKNLESLQENLVEKLANLSIEDSLESKTKKQFEKDLNLKIRGGGKQVYGDSFEQANLSTEPLSDKDAFSETDAPDLSEIQSKIKHDEKLSADQIKDLMLKGSPKIKLTSDQSFAAPAHEVLVSAASIPVATQVQSVTNADAIIAIEHIAKQTEQMTQASNINPIPVDQGQGALPIQNDIGLNTIPQNLTQGRMQNNVDLRFETASAFSSSGLGSVISGQTGISENRSDYEGFGNVEMQSIREGSGEFGDNQQGLDGTGFNSSITDALIGSKDVKAKYPDAIHEDALALFFGSSTDPLWDDFLLQERTKRWKDPVVLESKRDYMFKQSSGIVATKGNEIFVYELVYSHDADIDLIFKENHEILQLFMSLSKNRRSDQLPSSGIVDETKKDPEVELTPEQQDSLVVGNPDPIPTEPNLAEPEMFNKPPAFFDKGIMNELAYVERVMLNGLKPLKDMRYFRGQPRYVNSSSLASFDRNIVKGLIDPTVKFTKLNSTDNRLGVQIKGDVNVKDSSDLGIKIVTKHSCGFKI